MDCARKISTDVYPGHAAASSPRRKSLRLAGHDYAGGLYYVTQATQNRQRLFGTMLNGRMRLSPAGQMVFDIWHEIRQFCPAYSVDEFVMMPDHIHGIVRVHRDANNSVGAPLRGRPNYHQYVLENADDIVIGNLNPDGMLAFLLADLPRDTPVTVLSGGGSL